MKLLHLLFLFIMPVVVSAQAKETVFILLPANHQVFAEEMNYEVTLYQESSDKRFDHDVYTFNVLNTESIDRLPLRDLGREVSLDTIKSVLKDDFFLGKTACEAHEYLSSSHVYLVKEVVSRDPRVNKKYWCWSTHYAGTVKNVIKLTPHSKGDWLKD